METAQMSNKKRAIKYYAVYSIMEYYSAVRMNDN